MVTPTHRGDYIRLPLLVHVRRVYYDMSRMCTLGIVNMTLFKDEIFFYRLNKPFSTLCISLKRYLCVLLVEGAIYLQRSTTLPVKGYILFRRSSLTPSHTLVCCVNIPFQLFIVQLHTDLL